MNALDEHRACNGPGCSHLRDIRHTADSLSTDRLRVRIRRDRGVLGLEETANPDPNLNQHFTDGNQIIPSPSRQTLARIGNFVTVAEGVIDGVQR